MNGIIILNDKIFIVYIIEFLFKLYNKYYILIKSRLYIN